MLPVTATPNITARRRLLAATSATASINGVAATNLTVVSHSVITFLPPDASTLASVLNLDFAINVQGQLLAGRKYSYSTPTILSVSEASVFGGTVTVTGRNFGPVGSANILQVRARLLQRLLPYVARFSSPVLVAPPCSGSEDFR